MKMCKNNKRNQALYRYFGLGFQVNIKNVPLMEIDGEWVPDLNFNQIEEILAHAVPLKPAVLTGAEVAFLRRHLGMTQPSLGKILGVTKMAVSKWEKRKDEPTGMDLPTEKLLRIYVLGRKGIYGEIAQRAFDRIFTGTLCKHHNYRIDARNNMTPHRGIEMMLGCA